MVSSIGAPGNPKEHFYAANGTLTAQRGLEQAIAATPTGPLRDLLSAIQVQLGTAYLAQHTDDLAGVRRLNAILAGEQPATPTHAQRHPDTIIVQSAGTWGSPDEAADFDARR